MSEILVRLERLIVERKAALAADPALAETSYVARQLAKGRLRIARKLGEEATETVIAALAEPDDALVGEAADLLFHLLLLLADREIALAEVLAILERREGISGIEERKGRAP
ncbi:phosphoribosyl-ATP diphosphatase [Thermaurantiacus sp.]